MSIYPMSNKSQDLINAIEDIFPGTAEAIAYYKCPLCKSSIDPTRFKDAISLKEYEISGLCQTCQDDFFG